MSLERRPVVVIETGSTPMDPQPAKNASPLFCCFAGGAVVDPFAERDPRGLLNRLIAYGLDSSWLALGPNGDYSAELAKNDKIVVLLCSIPSPEAERTAMDVIDVIHGTAMCVLVPVIMPGQAEGGWWERNLSKTELSAVVDFRVQGKIADPKWLEQVRAACEGPKVIRRHSSLEVWRSKMNEANLKEELFDGLHGASNEETEKRIRKAFAKVDMDASGDITVEELHTVLQSIEVYATKEEVTSMIREADRYGSGGIDFADFRDLMKRLLYEQSLAGQKHVSK